MSHPGRKLTREDVITIRRLWREGASMTTLAAAYPFIHPHTLRHALVGFTYFDIPGWITPQERKDRRRGIR